jgi:lipopolysaccharide export system permease protein
MALLSLTMLFAVLALAEGLGRPLSKSAMSFRMLQVAEQGQPVRGDLWIADPAGIVRITDWNPGMEPRSVELFVFADDGALSQHIVSTDVAVEPQGSWRFRSATVTDFAAERVRPERVEAVSWRPEVYQNLSLFDLPVQGMSLPELRAEIARRQETAEEDVAPRLELWKRLLLPVACLVFGAFAAALGLRETERGGLGRRLAVGVMAALVLYLGQQIALNAALVAGLSPLLAALLPLLLVGGIAGVLLRRAT